MKSALGRAAIGSRIVDDAIVDSVAGKQFIGELISIGGQTEQPSHAVSIEAQRWMGQLQAAIDRGIAKV